MRAVRGTCGSPLDPSCSSGIVARPERAAANLAVSERGVEHHAAFGIRTAIHRLTRARDMLDRAARHVPRAVPCCTDRMDERLAREGAATRGCRYAEAWRSAAPSSRRGPELTPRRGQPGFELPQIPRAALDALFAAPSTLVRVVRVVHPARVQGTHSGAARTDADDSRGARRRVCGLSQMAGLARASV